MAASKADDSKAVPEVPQPVLGNQAGPEVKRASISPKLRFAVLSRDGFKCIYCGRASSSAPIEIDHKIPVSAGGLNDEGNLVSACIDCNRGKGGYVPMGLSPMTGSPRTQRTGGRPRGPFMPCGWCDELLTGTSIRPHFASCPKKPKAGQD